MFKDLCANPASDSNPNRMKAACEDRAGLDLIGQGRFEEAVAAFQKAIEIDPLYPDAYLDLGGALRLTGRREESITVLRQALALQPSWPMALYNLGTSLLDSGDLPGAIAAFRETTVLKPDWSLPYGGLGMALLVGSSVSEAKTALRKAVDLDPGLHVASHLLGLTHWACGEIEEAIRIYRESLRKDSSTCPDCHLSLSLALLKKGDYSEGWTEYEWRWQNGGQTPPLAQLERPLWDGSPLDGKKILLWAEQGLGDILQFVRFATIVHEDYGGAVHLLSRPSLDRLLATCPGVQGITSNVEELGDFDCQLPLASLPRVLGIGLEDLARIEIPYLTPPARWTRDPLGPRQEGRLRVGIVWGVEEGHPTWKERSCPIGLFRGLESVPGVELYSLQFGSRAAELRRPDAPCAADLSAVLGDFADTGALLPYLDLIVTVDTSMTHLAGALGLPVWTLLHWDPDWRWMCAREDSPWYPTMRLFRQSRPNAWEPVLAEVTSALEELIRSRLTPACTRSLPRASPRAPCV